LSVVVVVVVVELVAGGVEGAVVMAEPEDFDASEDGAGVGAGAGGGAEVAGAVVVVDVVFDVELSCWPHAASASAIAAEAAMMSGLFMGSVAPSG
jgi:hypothetical protein